MEREVLSSSGVTFIQLSCEWHELDTPLLNNLYRMKKKQLRGWVFNPTKPKVPEILKEQVTKKANQLVEQVLKPQNIKPPPSDERFNYIVDIYTKWRQNYFYFCATYNSPGPNAISPSFESCFARLEYTGNDRFSLSYMRHTGK